MLAMLRDSRLISITWQFHVLRRCCFRSREANANLYGPLYLLSELIVPFVRLSDQQKILSDQQKILSDQQKILSDQQKEGPLSDRHSESAGCLLFPVMGRKLLFQKSRSKCQLMALSYCEANANWWRLAWNRWLPETCIHNSFTMHSQYLYCEIVLPKNRTYVSDVQTPPATNWSTNPWDKTYCR